MALLSRVSGMNSWASSQAGPLSGLWELSSRPPPPVPGLLGKVRTVASSGRLWTVENSGRLESRPVVPQGSCLQYYDWVCFRGAKAQEEDQASGPQAYGDTK